MVLAGGLLHRLKPDVFRSQPGRVWRRLHSHERAQLNAAFQQQQQQQRHPLVHQECQGRVRRRG